FPTPWQARRLQWLLDTAAQSSIPMQRFIGAGAKGLAWWRGGGYWVVVSHESGRAPRNSELKGALLDSLAAAMARLHSIPARRSGALFAVGFDMSSLGKRLDTQIRSVLDA